MQVEGSLWLGTESGPQFYDLRDGRSEDVEGRRKARILDPEI